jgi:hypothetical protein
MCQKCVQRFKDLHLSSQTKAKTYGQVKALAYSFWKYHIVSVFDRTTNVGVEAHLHKIEQARTARRYKREKKVILD